MAMLMMEGFDQYSSVTDMDTGLYSFVRNVTPSSFSLNTSGGRFGGGALQATAPGGSGSSAILQSQQSNLVTYSATSGDYFILAFWFKMTVKPSANTGTVWAHIGSLTTNSLGLASSGGMSGDNGSWFTGGINLCDNQWHWVEYLAVMQNAVTPNKLYVDGTVIRNTTYNGGVTFTPNVQVGMQWGWGNISAFTASLDDFFWYNNYSTGITGDLDATSFPLGPQKVTLMRPTSNGSFTGWTPSASTNNTNIDDTGLYDGDTTYNSTTAGTGTKDTFVTGDMSTSDTGVKFVNVRMVAKNNTAGSAADLQALAYSGSILGASASAVTTNAYKATNNYIFTDPATGAAWTPSGVNSAEFGYGVV